MDYNFREIEKKWQAQWVADKTYQVDIDPDKPKFYVLDMFPYPSGAGLHVGHPLGYIASDIYARYKRLRGFNVLHPMGYDAYGLPAEQYAIQTGQHPAVTTENNIARYREQLDKIGFSFDWNREVRTCDPEFYKWTQWAFILMFNSYYHLTPNPSPQERGEDCANSPSPLERGQGGEVKGGVARPISELIEHFEKYGSDGLNVAQTEELHFTAEEWLSWDERRQQETLMNYRIAYLADTMVNWCPKLGTVLANDEVQDGISIRGGYPVEQRRMKQWSLRVSAYAQRLLDGLETIDWTDSLKETQRNWIGRSEGAEIIFHLTPNPSPKERGENCAHTAAYDYQTTNSIDWKNNIDNARQMRKEPTEAENILWQNLRNRNVKDLKFRRQHLIDQFIVDFVCIEKKLVVEVDGGYHNAPEQKEYDEIRTEYLNDNGFQVIRFTNEEILFDLENVLKKIVATAENIDCANSLSPLERGQGGEVKIFTTRADTIYGVTFMVLAPESEYVESLTTDEQRSEVAAYLEQTKKRTERERIADRRVTGVFSGSYAINPVSGEEIPIWISDYVLAGYGTGAIMAVPAHDSRDYAFAKHFGLPIIPLIEGADISEDSFDAKEGIMMNSPHLTPNPSPKEREEDCANSPSPLERGQGGEVLNLNGLTVKEAIAKTKKFIEDNGLGKVKVNYRLRDAIFSRQRYWGEPFPIYYKDGMPYAVALDDLPIQLPEVDKFLPTETGEPPLGRAKGWEYQPSEL